MIDKVWAKPHFRRGTKGDRAPPVGLHWKQWSLVGGPGCDQTYDDRKAEYRTCLVAPLLE